MNNQTQTLAMGENTENQVLEEGVAFITKRDGNGGEIQIINLNWDGWCPREGMVELTPLKFGKGLGNVNRHQNEASFKTTKDKRYGFIIGIAMPGYGRDKEIQFERISVKGVEFLDLSNKREREKWICIKLGPFLVGSPNVSSQSKTRYMCVDKEKESKDFRLNLRKKDEAYGIAKALVGTELIEMGVALGMDVKLVSEETLWMNIVKLVQNEVRDQITKKTGAEVFIEIYNSDVKKETVILKRGLSTGVLTHSITDGVIQYNGLPLGHTENEAIQYLKNNPTTRASIDMLSSKTSNQSTQVKASVSAVNVEANETIKRQSDEMAELRKQLADMQAKQSGEPNEEGIRSELEELLAKGKQMDIKGIHALAKNKSEAERIQAVKDKISEYEVKVTN